MIRTLLPGLLLASVAALAQEQAPAPEETPASGAAGKEIPAEADNTVASEGPAEPASAPRQAPEDYRPSEEISEDLSVSFPVDI